MARPKLTFTRSPQTDDSAPAAGSCSCQIYSTYRRTCTGAFFGQLKVVRMRDNRLIFPFEGAPEIGPFEQASQARDAAKELGEKIIEADIQNPE